MDDISIVIDDGVTLSVQITDDPDTVLNVQIQDADEQFIITDIGDRGDPGRPPNDDEVDAAVDRYIADHPITTYPAERSYAIASDTWDWEHNLGYTPAVVTLASDRSEIVGRLTYNDNVRTTVQFFHPVAGIMALS